MSDIAVIKNHAPTTARDYNESQLQLIRRTVAKDTTADEFNMFCEICKRNGLDPFKRQIYALVFNKDKADKRQVAFITGIDGYRAIANRTGEYMPSNDEPVFDTRDDLVSESNPAGLVSCTTKVLKLGKDGNYHPIIATARWSEYAPILEEKELREVLDTDGNPVMQTEGQWAGRPKKEYTATGKKKLAKENWKTMPFLMLEKCAEALALRRGWPEDCGGLYVDSEMDAARLREDRTASEVLEDFEEKQRLERVGAVKTVPMILSMTDGIAFIPLDQVYDKVMEHLVLFDEVQQIDFWLDQNRSGLQQFWAYNKNDGLALNKAIEELKEKKEKENVVS